MSQIPGARPLRWLQKEGKSKTWCDQRWENAKVEIVAGIGREKESGAIMSQESKKFFDSSELFNKKISSINSEN